MHAVGWNLFALCVHKYQDRKPDRKPNPGLTGNFYGWTGMRIQICLHWNFFDRTNHVQTISHWEEEQLSRIIDLAKKIARSKIETIQYVPQLTKFQIDVSVLSSGSTKWPWQFWYHMYQKRASTQQGADKSFIHCNVKGVSIQSSGSDRHTPQKITFILFYTLGPAANNLTISHPTN